MKKILVGLLSIALWTACKNDDAKASNNTSASAGSEKIQYHLPS